MYGVADLKHILLSKDKSSYSLLMLLSILHCNVQLTSHSEKDNFKRNSLQYLVCIWQDYQRYSEFKFCALVTNENRW